MTQGPWHKKLRFVTISNITFSCSINYKQYLDNEVTHLPLLGPWISSDCLQFCQQGWNLKKGCINISRFKPCSALSLTWITVAVSRTASLLLSSPSPLHCSQRTLKHQFVIPALDKPKWPPTEGRAAAPYNAPCCSRSPAPALTMPSSEDTPVTPKLFLR